MPFRALALEAARAGFQDNLCLGQAKWALQATLLNQSSRLTAL